jgi:hypothetical protein
VLCALLKGARWLAPPCPPRPPFFWRLCCVLTLPRFLQNPSLVSSQRARGQQQGGGTYLPALASAPGGHFGGTLSVAGDLIHNHHYAAAPARHVLLRRAATPPATHRRAPRPR